MSEPSYQSSENAAPAERTLLPVRAASNYAEGRCIMYAIVSDLAASPFDAEPTVAGKEIDIAGLELPYQLPDFQTLLDEWRTADREELKREYSGLFEVGSQGPPVPIREDLHRNQPAGLREDIVRFYDFFGYGLEENFAWAPDHLSVELEFMHFLTYKEAEHAESVDAKSFQLAQHDFAERHLCTWLPELVERVQSQNPESFYLRVIAAINEFLLQDVEWQQSTIEEG